MGWVRNAVRGMIFVAVGLAAEPVAAQATAYSCRVHGMSNDKPGGGWQPTGGIFTRSAPDQGTARDLAHRDCLNDARARGVPVTLESNACVHGACTPSYAGNPVQPDPNARKQPDPTQGAVGAAMQRKLACESWARAVLKHGADIGFRAGGCKLPPRLSSPQPVLVASCERMSAKDYARIRPDAEAERREIDAICAKQAAANARLSPLQRFQANAGKPIMAAKAPPKPSGVDQSRKPVCASFARHAAMWQKKAIALRCDLKPIGRHIRTEAGHLDWCMRTSDAVFRQRSPQALGFKSGVEKHCSAQLKRPVKL